MDCLLRRRGRVAEGGGLLNRYTFKRRIEGSNPSVSANNILKSIIYGCQKSFLIFRAAITARFVQSKLA
jgi:hypothetical protein